MASNPQDKPSKDKDAVDEDSTTDAVYSQLVNGLSQQLAEAQLRETTGSGGDSLMLHGRHGAQLRSIDSGKKKEYKFWATQPVPKIDETITCNEAIEEDKPVEEIRSEPYSLPGGFYWDTLDLENESQLSELYALLNENYVEDEDNMFRFDYSPAFLKWALQPPGWLRDWHVAVRVDKNKKLIGFISAVPTMIRIHNKEKRMVEINFLCVHKKLRSKRVAPVLIREITRRVNMRDIFQAVYTGGVVLPKPVATCRYWHRSLNPRKLIECNFSHLSRNMTMQRTVKLYRLPDSTQTPGFRPMVEKDIEQAQRLLMQYLSKFQLYPVFNMEEFRHWFLPRSGIINTFVVETEGVVTDLCSFYTLPSSVIQNKQHNSLNAAYSFYNVAEKTNWTALMKDTLVSAKQRGFDVFNALDLMDNKQFLEELKFGIGDGNLHYYLYNWRCPSLAASQVALVLQ